MYLAQDLAMIVTGLVGALIVSSYKWGLWTFGTAVSRTPRSCSHTSDH